jgi:geranylgeranylglyceryl phosphate synthase family protein
MVMIIQDDWCDRERDQGRYPNLVNAVAADQSIPVAWRDLEQRYLNTYKNQLSPRLLPLVDYALRLNPGSRNNLAIVQLDQGQLVVVEQDTYAMRSISERIHGLTDVAENPSAMYRLLQAQRMAHQACARFESNEMKRAGFVPSTREGIWIYLADMSLQEQQTFYALTDPQQQLLMELFVILRRIYKSADSAYDSCPDVRVRLSRDPTCTLRERFVYTIDDKPAITDMRLLLDYTRRRLLDLFPAEDKKRAQILELITSFIRDAAKSLAFFGTPVPARFQDCESLHQSTTGAIGHTVAQIIVAALENDTQTLIDHETLENIFFSASMVAQWCDDIADILLDIFDMRSPSMVKAFLHDDQSEYANLVAYAAQYPKDHISFQQLFRLAPRTAHKVSDSIDGYTIDLPASIRQFLSDLRHLPPAFVSHQDPNNIDQHTPLSAVECLRDYNAHYIPWFELEPWETKCKIAMLVDPAEQSPQDAARRVAQFLDAGDAARTAGGQVVLIGGSGPIDSEAFDKTIAAITKVTQKAAKEMAVLVFPGNPEQIPTDSRGVTGLLNYVDVIGASGCHFCDIYPDNIRDHNDLLLRKRKIRSIPTLYVLCGKSDARVSQVTGILPFDLQLADQREQLFAQVRRYLELGTAIVYLEGGSGAAQPISLEIVRGVRQLIDDISPRTLLFVGGGISMPEKVQALNQYANCIVVGTLFERDPQLTRAAALLAASKRHPIPAMPRPAP